MAGFMCSCCQFAFLVVLVALGGVTKFALGQVKATIFSDETDVSDLKIILNDTELRDVLKSQYHGIQTGLRGNTVEIASLPENIKKNRYDDLLAFDQTRVILDILHDDPFSDYINANYLDGHNGDKEYVATQGPLNNTVNDFWRMIWQLNAKKIVMLANVIEHGQIKVEKYWPEVNKTYGKIVVTKLSEHAIGDDHVVRTFSLRMEGNPETRVIRHFHFTGWPDMGVPSERLSLVALIQQARKYKSEDTAPIVVHCSAGVGRTGTVILLDSMMESAKATNMVNFPRRLNSMRGQRIDVVEKEEQYLFANDAVNEVFNYKPKSEPYLKKIDDEYRALMDPEEASYSLPSSARKIQSFLRQLNPLGFF